MRNNQLMMAIDIGTTSVKCMIINDLGEVKASASNGYSIMNRFESWVEQEPIDWWHATIKSIKDCLKKVHVNKVKAISFSGQMSAPVFLDNKGHPVYPSILISDTRSQNQSDYLYKNHLKNFTERTGNEPINAFTVSKLLWMKEKEPKIMKMTSKFVFPKDFVRYKITGHIGTDPTDAGNSLLYNAEEKCWNWRLISDLGLSTDIFPDIKSSGNQFGVVTNDASKVTGLVEGTPVITGAADIACSQIGTGAVNDNTLSITLSTSGQIVMGIPNINKKGIGKVTFHNGAIEDSNYAMGTIFTGGLGVEWGFKKLYNKQLMDKSDYQELDRLTNEMKNYPPGSNGLLFLPFLVGSSTPYYDIQDRAAWIGMSLHQAKSLMLHSILEGITFNILENVQVMNEMDLIIQKVHLGAGGSQNKVWCKMIADVLGQNVSLLENRDGSALGAAILAGTGVGIFDSIKSAVESIVKVNQYIMFDKTKNEDYKKLFKGYQEVYQSLNYYYHTYTKT